jgi:hypothetical protein
MNGEIQSQINQFLYHLSCEDLAKASKNVKAILEAKINERFAAAEKELFAKKKSSK